MSLCLGLLSFGCGGDENTTIKYDAANGGSGGGKGGSGGSGGSKGSGGSNASGGSVGSGGSSASGGSGGASSSGGESGSGGAADTGGSGDGGTGGLGGDGTGGSGGAGGSTSEDAAATTDDGGSASLDVRGSDAIDAPLTDEDAPVQEDTTKADGGAPVVLDATVQDTAGVDSQPYDTAVVLMDTAAPDSVDTPDAEPDAQPDAEPDAEPDMGPDTAPDTAPDLGPDIAADTGPDLPPNPVPCPSVPILSIAAGQSSLTYQPVTTGSFCFATCDDVLGWSCGEMGADRQVYVNGQLIESCGSSPLPPKVAGTYYIFQVTSGSAAFAFINWYLASPSTGETCLPPDGGFGLN